MSFYPLLGLGLGATTSAIGAGGLAAVLWGSPTMTKSDRYTVGTAMALLIGVGAILSTVSTSRLEGRG